MFGGSITIGTLCKACELVQKINTNTSLQYEIPANFGYINQYFREFGIAISERSINAGNAIEYIKPTLGIICVALPIALTSSVIAAHFRNRK